jgi:hypothetical protein
MGLVWVMLSPYLGGAAQSWATFKNTSRTMGLFSQICTRRTPFRVDLLPMANVRFDNGELVLARACYNGLLSVSYSPAPRMGA